MSYTYVPGRGYTVRDCRGRVLGHSLSVSQRDALLQCAHQTLIPNSLLPINGG